MNGDSPAHERPCPATGGHSPQSAARDLRGILEAGGGVPWLDLVERRAAETRAVVRWAERVGWLDSEYYLTPAREGGLEHRLWMHEDSGRVMKVTLAGRFGRTVRLVQPAPDRRELIRLVRFDEATPLEYLDRLALHNDAFGDDVRVLGAVRDRSGYISFVISQRFLRGSRPQEAEVRQFMRNAGFSQLGCEPAYFRAQDSVVAFDAHTANFVRTEGETVPFDLITFHPDGEMARLLSSFP